MQRQLGTPQALAKWYSFVTFRIGSGCHTEGIAAHRANSPPFPSVRFEPYCARPHRSVTGRLGRSFFELHQATAA